MTNANNSFKNALKTSRIFGSEADRLKALCNVITIKSTYFEDREYSIGNALDELLTLSKKRNEFEMFTQAFINVIDLQKQFQGEKFNAIEYLDSIARYADDNFKPALYAVYTIYYKLQYDDLRAIQKIKETFRLSKDEHTRILCLMVLGDIYMNFKKTNESLGYFYESLELAKKSSKDAVRYYKPKIYCSIGINLFESKDYKKAISYLNDAVNYKGNFKFTDADLCTIYNYTGLCYVELDNIPKSKYYINKSLILSDSIRSHNLKLFALETKAKLLIKTDEIVELDKTIKLISGLVEEEEDYFLKLNGYKILGNYYKSNNNFDKSLQYLEKWVTTNDSLKNKQTLQTLNEFQTKYETEKKEQQIVLQDTQIKSQHRFLIVLSISGVLLLIAFVFIFILYNKRNQAYKRLVFQSIDGMTGNLDSMSEFAPNEKDISEEVENEGIKITQMSDEQKLQLIKTLTEQMDKKVYLQPDITINKLAELCSTNRTYLSQLINEYYLMNFSAFINKYRIEEAKNILIAEKADVQLKNLYPKLGFNSYTVFNDAFKKYIGVTPAFFLRTVKEEKQN